jgi:hypothetical protein
LPSVLLPHPPSKVVSKQIISKAEDTLLIAFAPVYPIIEIAEFTARFKQHQSGDHTNGFADSRLPCDVPFDVVMTPPEIRELFRYKGLIIVQTDPTVSNIKMTIFRWGCAKEN